MNKIFLNLTIALRVLYTFKLRSALALIGVFLGTFSLIMVSNLSGSFTKKTMFEIKSLGENLLIIKSGIVKHFGAKTRLFGEAINLKTDDASAILENSRFVKQISCSSGKTFPVRYEKKVLTSVLIVGVGPNYPETRNFKLQKGRFLSKKDNDEFNKVVVLGTKVVEKIFGHENPVGKHILIHKALCRVIGIMEEKGADMSGADQDNQIFIPLDTFLKRVVNKNYIDTIYVQAINEDSLPFAKTEIESILRFRHKITAEKKDDFTVLDLKDVMALKTQAVDMTTVLGRISAIISFLIGGVGILSIMILIVNERKVEIGIRRAVGATRHNIVFQFLLESSIISFCGGALGVVFGFIISLIVFILSGLPVNISFKGLIFSFVASSAVGVLAGIYPSQRAVAVQPVDIISS